MKKTLLMGGRPSSRRLNCSLDRLKVLQQGLKQDDLVLEIGPADRPIAPKRDGYRTINFDVFDRAQILEHLLAKRRTPAQAEMVEEVDIVLSEQGFQSDVMAYFSRHGLPTGQTIDFICSSHNFEHLPNPVGFLQSCEALLKPGGRLSMAVPDHRLCFDHFFFPTLTGDVIDAMLRSDSKPSPGSLFAASAYDARWADGGLIGGFEGRSDVALSNPNFMHAARKLADASVADSYMNCHCWHFTPASLELVLIELNALGLIGLTLLHGPTRIGAEIIVQLGRGAVSGEGAPGVTSNEWEDHFSSVRQELLQRLKLEQLEGLAMSELQAADWPELLRLTTRLSAPEISVLTSSLKVRKRLAAGLGGLKRMMLRC